MRDTVNEVLGEVRMLLHRGLPTETLRSSRFLWTRLAVVLTLMLGSAMVLGTLAERLGLAREMIFLGAGAGPLTWRVWLLGVVLAPVAEELVFRSGLRSATMAALLLWSLLLVIALVSPQRPAMLGLLALFTVGALLSLLNAQRRRALLPWVHRVLLRHRALWVHLSTVSFALVHLSNWQVISGTPVRAVVLVLPQLVTGYGLAYICIRMGLRWSILAHALFNACVFLMETVASP